MSLFSFFSSVVILVAVAVALLNEIFQQKAKVSPMPTVPRVREKMLAHIPPQTRGKMVELGAGWGTLAVPMARQFPGNEVVAIEVSPVPFLVLHLRKILGGLKNLTILRRDFFDYKLDDVQIVLCYLSNPHMARLEPKFRAELPKGAKIISSTFHMPQWEPSQTVDLTGVYNTKIYIYTV